MITIILCAALAGALAQTSVFAGAYSEDAVVEITLGGKLYGTYPLSEPRVIEVDDAYNNVVAIEKDKAGEMQVLMRDADCPGKDCVEHAPIDLNGQNIVCLPAKLVVKIRKGDSDIDGYTY